MSDKAPATEERPFGHRNLPLLLLMAREAVMSNFRPILNRHGITEQQWRILRVLIEAGEMEQRLICDACQILAPSLAGILSRMEEVGLIERRKVPNDQRRVLVAPTQQARDVAKAMAPAIEARYGQLEEELGKPFLDEFYSMIDQLLAYHDKAFKGLPSI